jgi:glycosyltransferase involved in cell wall biosynthesis
MNNEIAKISVVVPVYNSSKVLYELQAQIEKAFTELSLVYQLILVDDYSQDDSWDIIKDIKSKNKANIVAVRMAKNFGQHNAIFCGLHYCTGDIIITMDDDLQNPPSEIKHLLQRYKETNADVVYGTSSSYSKPIARRVASRSFKTVTKLSSKAIGEGSSFRLLKKDMVAKLVKHTQYFVFVDELISWYSSNVEFTEVRHEPSQLKKSRYDSSKLFNLFYELAISYNTTPLKMITYLGFTSSLVSFLFGVYFIARKFFFHVRLGYTSIIVSIMFSAGLILLSIGVIGETLRRMYNIMNTQPQYSVGEVLE